MAQSMGNLNKPLTVTEFLDAWREEWALEVIAGEATLENVIDTADINRPGLALAGYYEVFSAERVQLIGLTETRFLASLDPAARAAAIQRTLAFHIPCVLVTTGLDICEELIETCRERAIPLLRTSHATSSFQAELIHYLERRLAPSWMLHGVMMDVFGMGVLIQGSSGVGKSECGLELIQRGHRLIGDDVVVIRRVGRNQLIAETPPNIGYHMEIRGIGIIDVELLFGVQVIREQAPIHLRVKLEHWDSDKDYERLGLKDRESEMFDCNIPLYVLPVQPGRNIAMLIEVAALTQRLESQGINVAREFDRRIQEAIQKKTSSSPKKLFSAIDRLHRPGKR